MKVNLKTILFLPLLFFISLSFASEEIPAPFGIVVGKDTIIEVQKKIKCKPLKKLYNNRFKTCMGASEKTGIILVVFDEDEKVAYIESSFFTDDINNSYNLAVKKVDEFIKKWTSNAELLKKTQEGKTFSYIFLHPSDIIMIAKVSTLGNGIYYPVFKIFTRKYAEESSSN